MDKVVTKTMTYEIQVDSGEWAQYDPKQMHQGGLITADLLLELFECGVTLAALDIRGHNVKIIIIR
jgi:hypothetical protein